MICCAISSVIHAQRSDVACAVHPGLPPNYDEPSSWSSEFPYFSKSDEPVAEDGNDCPADTSPWCSDQPGVPVDDYLDGQIVTEAVRRLGVLVNRSGGLHRNRASSSTTTDFHHHSNPLGRPVFMAVGLHRPHMDWVTPPSFLAKQPPPAQIPLAVHRSFNQTPWAFYNCTELTGRARLRALGACIRPNPPLDDLLARTIRRQCALTATTGCDSTGSAVPCNNIIHLLFIDSGCGHVDFASVEFMDHQVGRLLRALEDFGLRNNTVVIFHGDHVRRALSIFILFCVKGKRMDGLDQQQRHVVAVIYPLRSKV